MPRWRPGRSASGRRLRAFQTRADASPQAQFQQTWRWAAASARSPLWAGAAGLRTQTCKHRICTPGHPPCRRGAHAHTDCTPAMRRACAMQARRIRVGNAPVCSSIRCCTNCASHMRHACGRAQGGAKRRRGSRLARSSAHCCKLVLLTMRDGAARKEQQTQDMEHRAPCDRILISNSRAIAPEYSGARSTSGCPWLSGSPHPASAPAEQWRGAWCAGGWRLLPACRLQVTCCRDQKWQAVTWPSTQAACR